MSMALAHEIDARSRQGKMDDGTPCRTIGVKDVRRLADEAGIAGCAVEAAALEMKVIPTRYLRNMKTLSIDDQRRLVQASVCIVGLGGLGGLVAETLARVGVGRLGLIDHDRFDEHNLNRQLFSHVDNIGLLKCEAGRQRVQAVNPGVDVVAAGRRLTERSAAALLEGHHLVMDCLDTIPARFTLAAAARRADVPLVSAAIAGISGHVTSIFPGDDGLANVYGSDTRAAPSKGVETRLGCLAPGVNLIASLACTEALKLLLHRDGTLRNRLLVVDLNDYTVETLRFS